MFDCFTGWRISVERADAAGAYIIVPVQQVAVLCCLLAEHAIPHSVEGAVPSRHHAESPSEPVVRLGPTVEPDLVQHILDLAP